MSEPATAAPLSLDAFLALGKALANGTDGGDGTELTPLYDAFTPLPGLADLAAIVAATPPAERAAAIAAKGLTGLASSLTAAWYGGMVLTDLTAADYDAAAKWVAAHAPTVTTYYDAAVWATTGLPAPGSSTAGWASWTGKPAAG